MRSHSKSKSWTWDTEPGKPSVAESSTITANYASRLGDSGEYPNRLLRGEKALGEPSEDSGSERSYGDTGFDSAGIFHQWLKNQLMELGEELMTRADVECERVCEERLRARVSRADKSPKSPKRERKPSRQPDAFESQESMPIATTSGLRGISDQSEPENDKLAGDTCMDLAERAGNFLREASPGNLKGTFRTLQVWSDHFHLVIAWEESGRQAPERGPSPLQHRHTALKRRAMQESMSLSFHESLDSEVWSQPIFNKHVTWTCMALLLLLHDAAVIPLLVCFDYETATRGDVAAWVSRIFWLLDMFGSFLTVSDREGVFETNPKRVALSYARTWFLFDLIVLAPEWLLLVDEEAVKPYLMVTVMRSLHVLRLLRIIKRAVTEGKWVNLKVLRFLMKTDLCRIPLLICMGVHMMACIWYAVGRHSNNGWVHTHIDSHHDFGDRYLISLEWSLGLLHGESVIVPEKGNTLEIAFHDLAMLVSLCLFLIMVGSATKAVESVMDVQGTWLKEEAVQYVKDHNISGATQSRLKMFAKQRQRLELLGVKIKGETDFLACLPTLLRIDLLHEARVPISIGCQFLQDLQDVSIMRELCHVAMSNLPVLCEEIIFHTEDACSRVLFIERGLFSYESGKESQGNDTQLYVSSMLSSSKDEVPPSFSAMGSMSQALRSISIKSPPAWPTSSRIESGNSTGMLRQTSPVSFKPGRSVQTFEVESESSRFRDRQELRRGPCISEPVLWSRWHHAGRLAACTDGTLLEMDAQRFAEVVVQSPAACLHAVRYARKFVLMLNQHPGTHNDLSSFESSLKNGRLDEGFGDRSSHLAFLSHYKVEAGTEATLLKDGLESLLSGDISSPTSQLEAPIFLDSEDLTDLKELREHVRKSANLLLLLTPNVLQRPWVLVEIYTAWKSDGAVRIVPVEIQQPHNTFEYPTEEYYQRLESGVAFAESVQDLLTTEGITAQNLAEAVREVFSSIASPYSPHKPQAVRAAEVQSILDRCLAGVHRISRGKRSFVLPRSGSRHLVP